VAIADPAGRLPAGRLLAGRLTAGCSSDRTAVAVAVAAALAGRHFGCMAGSGLEIVGYD
jgi:hypothetical protein